MSNLARALLADFDADDLRELARRLVPYLPAPTRPEPDRWMDTKRAASYLGMSVSAIHRLTAERAIPFEQNGPGGKCWFKRSDLDAWRRPHG